MLHNSLFSERLVINKSRESWELIIELKRFLAKKELEIDWKFLHKYLFVDIACIPALLSAL